MSKVNFFSHGVEIDDNAREQIRDTASLPCVEHLAVMPDAHWGMGSTVGTVIATRNAIIPAAVGVDIGCGMVAVRTTLTALDLPDNLAAIRSSIEAAVPHGRTNNGTYSDKGGNRGRITDTTQEIWDRELKNRFEALCDIDNSLWKTNHIQHLGTLGTGNHFIELCLDLDGAVWIMLHSGSRGVGNRIGMTFIKKAQKEAGPYLEFLPNKDLAFFTRSMPGFPEYWTAMQWAQDFASWNRKIMLGATIKAIEPHVPPFDMAEAAINCHHNYATIENHFGKNYYITRKGAVRARKGDLGIIPGSMGTRSYITRGLGNPDSLMSSSHGAGRVMSRGEARRTITEAAHAQALIGVECNDSRDTLDESPSAYKDIDDVMDAQSDNVEIVHTLKQIVCVKG